MIRRILTGAVFVVFLGLSGFWLLTLRSAPLEELSDQITREPNEKGKSTDGRRHQPGQGAFRSVLPEDIDWKPFPAFPLSVRLAIVVGDPSAQGPYVTRVKVPSGVKLMPHRHPEDRVYTVMSGVFYIGLGDNFEADKLHAYPPGSVIVLPGNTFHYHWAKSGEYVTQITAIGPLGLEYKNATDDPRKNTQPPGTRQ